MMKLEYEGIFTSGYYNDMENGYPVFIDEESVSNIIKSVLENKGMNNNFCDFLWCQDHCNDDFVHNCKRNDDECPFSYKNNKLIGKKVKLILEIEE